MKKLIIALISVVYIVSGCKKYDDVNILGTWKNSKNESVFTFESNGRYVFHIHSMKGKYSLKSNELTLKGNFDLIYTVEDLTGENLSLRLKNNSKDQGIPLENYLYLKR